MADGPNVDIVPEATYQWKEIENDTYDITISGQALGVNSSGSQWEKS